MKLLGAMLGSLSSGAVVGAAAIKSEILGMPLSEATLMHIEDELDKAVGKSGITRSPLFNDLSKMINDTMAPSILTAHSGAESQLDGFRTAFEVCTAPDVSTDSSGTTSKAISDKLAEHRQCRQNEQTAKMGADECDKDLKQKTAVQQSGCNSVPGSDGTPPALDTNGHVGCKVTAGDYEGWLNSFSHQIESLKTQFDEAKGGCGNATKLVDDARPKCVAANQSAATNKSACDGLQAQADQMGCSNDPTAAAACQTYHSCYDAAKKNYLDANESIAAAQLNRTVQWRVLKRIQCLLSEEAQGATHDGIDACREATIDTSHLDLVYPVVPAKVECSVHPAGGARPCSSEWTDLYGLSGETAPAAPCTPCEVTVCDCQKPEHWTEYVGKSSTGEASETGLADGRAMLGNEQYDLEGAKLACMAKQSCMAITCHSDRYTSPPSYRLCTLRYSRDLFDSKHYFGKSGQTGLPLEKNSESTYHLDEECSQLYLQCRHEGRVLIGQMRPDSWGGSERFLADRTENGEWKNGNLVWDTAASVDLAFQTNSYTWKVSKPTDRDNFHPHSNPNLDQPAGLYPRADVLRFQVDRPNMKPRFLGITDGMKGRTSVLATIEDKGCGHEDCFVPPVARVKEININNQKLNVNMITGNEWYVVPATCGEINPVSLVNVYTHTYMDSAAGGRGPLIGDGYNGHGSAYNDGRGSPYSNAYCTKRSQCSNTMKEQIENNRAGNHLANLQIFNLTYEDRQPACSWQKASNQAQLGFTTNNYDSPTDR